MDARLIDIGKLESNTGQIAGLPKNPRFIKDDRFKKLVKSIQDTPEMLEMRECLVVPNGKKFVPKYCDVIVKRWEEFTGQKAELIND